MYKQRQLIMDFKFFLAIVAVLIITGLIFIYSASSIYALEQFGSMHYFVRKQLLGLLLGCLALLVAASIPLEFIKKQTPSLFFASLALTMLTQVPYLSKTVHGSSRWLKLAGFSFQPSEFLKIAFVLYLAHFLNKKKSSMNSIVHTFIPFLLIVILTSVVLLKQPDFGLTITLILTSAMMLFIGQFSIRRLLIMGATFVPSAAMLIYLQPYRLKRIASFINPWADPLGSGFQIIQSLIAIGSGNVWGLGISHSKQKFFYLPMQHTDFIFSIIAEETGFIGSLILILIYIFFLYFGVSIAWQLNDRFCSLVVSGFVLLLSLQAFINISVATALAPTKGMGLPFVSYGNSALMANLCMIGFIANMVRDQC